MLLEINVIKPRESEFVKLDINTHLKDLYQYDVCLFSIGFADDVRYLNLKTLPDLSGLDIPFHQWMAGRSFDGYLTVADKSFYTTKRVKQHNLTAKALFRPVNITGSDTDETPAHLCRDIQMPAPEGAISLLSNCLVSINGYFHRTDADSKSLYIIGGNRPYTRKGYFNPALVDFSDLGGLSSFNMDGQGLLDIQGDNAYFKLPEVLGDRTPFVVVLGKLFICGGDTETVKLVSDSAFAVNIGELPLAIMRAVEDGIVTREELGLTILDDATFSVAELKSEATFRAVFDLPHTFGGFINRKRVHVRSRMIECFNSTNVYFLKGKENNPLVLSNTGEVVNYNKRDVNISITENKLLENHRLDDSNWHREKYVKLRKVPIDRFDDLKLYEYFITGE